MTPEEQKKYGDLQLIDRQVRQIQEQLSMLDQQIGELAFTLENLNSFEKTKQDSELLVPFSSGVFFKAKLTDSTNFVVSIGSNTLVDKTKEELEKIFSSQLQQLNQYKESLMIQLQSLFDNALNIELTLKNKQ